jgi:hypothetical protein
MRGAIDSFEARVTRYVVLPGSDRGNDTAAARGNRMAPAFGTWAAALAVALLAAAPRPARAQAPTCDATQVVLSYTGAVQDFVVPAAVTSLTIDAAGAAGGAAAPDGGGAGARLVAAFAVTPGETLHVLVGGQGQSFDSVGGGGGGSFVYRTADAAGLLMAAAGGGGEGIDDSGIAGSATTTASNGSGGGSAGVDGSGGGGRSGGGGGGLLTNGGGGSGGSTGGQALANGGAGGSPGGGFGGGGGSYLESPAIFHGGGGGGGYNGGGGGSGYWSSPRPDSGSGGGGGSFSATPVLFGQSGANTGNGQVTLCYAQNAAPALAKSFDGASVPLGGTTRLGFTLTNPNAGTALTSLAFTDSLPAGLVVASPNQLTGSCGAGTITAVAGSATVALSGGTLPAGGACTFGVAVRATSMGGKVNTTSAVTSAEGQTGAAASASLEVTEAEAIPVAGRLGLAVLALLLAALAVALLRT